VGIETLAVIGSGLMGRGIAYVSALGVLHRSLGEKYKPAPLMLEYVKAGRLGRKVGRGVYDYTGTS